MMTSVLYCLTFGSAITDIWKNKIFNTWLLGGCLARILIGLLGSGMGDTLLSAFAKAGMTLLLLIPVYLIRGIGGGDVKLFTVSALYLTQGELVSCLILAFLIGAAFGVVKMIIKGKEGNTIHFALPIMISIFLVTANGALICC